MNTARMQRIIDKLNPYMDKIFCSPLSQIEIISLEQKLNIQFPEYFKIYLENIGFLQDLIKDNLLTTEGEYCFEKDFINTCNKQGSDYFAFAHNGGGDLFLLKAAKHDDDMIYRLYHHNGKIVKTTKSFIDYVDKAANKTIKEYKKRKYNKDKFWNIQLLFDTNKEETIISIFQNVWNVQESKEWVFKDQTPAGVIEYLKIIAINGYELQLSKCVYTEWETPLYAINFEIPATDKIKQEEISKLDILFKNTKDLNYKLLSYGVF